MANLTTRYIFTPPSSTWLWVLLILSIAGLLVSLITVVRTYRTGRFYELIYSRGRENPMRLIVVPLFLSLLLLSFFQIARDTYERSHKLYDDFQQGRFTVVEGPVHVLRTEAVKEHHFRETITVGGVTFQFNSYDSDPGYHLTIEQGGILREGAYVRLFYTDGLILRIDMRDAAPPRTLTPSPARLQAPWLYGTP